MQRIVYTYGAFDVLHLGHVLLLARAARLGDYLIVGILSDEAIRNRKGNDRPIHTQLDRAKVVQSIRYVNEVIFQDTYDPIPSMRSVDTVHILTKGDDWEDCKKSAEIFGCHFIPLNYTNGYSTTEILKK